MSTVRFYVRWENGDIENDETYVIDTAAVMQIAKPFTQLGRRGDIVLEFDPPLVVPPPVREACNG